jgi:uncharacterized membrane protein YoaK (UPF0700 family)
MSGHVAEARRVFVPDLEDRHGPLPPFLLLLTVVTGVVDAFSYLRLGHVFVANMTGNVVFLAFSLGGAAGFSAWASIAALLSFAVGAFIGGRVAHVKGRHRGKLLATAITIEFAFVALAFAWSLWSDTPYPGLDRYVLIILVAIGMGIQNAAARALGVPDLTTTVLTLTITGISADSRAAGGTGSKVGRRLVSAVGMFAGAVIGTLIAVHSHGSFVLLTAVVLLAIAGVAAATLRNSTRRWIGPL